MLELRLVEVGLRKRSVCLSLANALLYSPCGRGGMKPGGNVAGGMAVSPSPSSELESEYPPGGGPSGKGMSSSSSSDESSSAGGSAINVSSGVAAIHRVSKDSNGDQFLFTSFHVKHARRWDPVGIHDRVIIDTPFWS